MSQDENKDVIETGEDTNQGVEGTGEAGTQPEENNEGADIQAQAQKIADGMGAKKMKGMPTKEELKAFKEWQDSQKTADEKAKETLLEQEKLKSENEILKQERSILKAGVSDDDLDYVLFKVAKMEGDIEDNLKEYLEVNPKYVCATEPTQKKSTGVATQRGGSLEDDGVTAILKAKYPDMKL